MNDPSATIRPLNLPPVQLRVKTCADGVRRIYDRLRDKFVALTPEEWVRQNFVGYMVESLGYPSALMANEVALELNGTRRRCDTVLFAPPLMQCIAVDGLKAMAIVEYKAPDVEITQEVFDQIARYNIIMGAQMLVVSNGLRHYCLLTLPGSPPKFLPNIPAYQELKRICECAMRAPDAD